ncbi:aclacinomycin oxidase [Streptomyces sp. OspMP-M43]|nr:aclacinomycin oxidase [Streptomyces sp. OspMP-M43]
MSSMKRRGFLTAAMISGGALATGAASPASARPGRDAGWKNPAACPQPYRAVTVRPGDSRYNSLTGGHNQRFVGRPVSIRVVSTTEQVVAAVEEAVAAGRRIAVRSGGHCFEGFTASPDVQVLLDMSQFDAVHHDPERRAFVVEPGATLGHVYRTLFKNWGVTIPGGACLDVAAGGHITGGGYGHLSRRHGLVSDHLYAVEVVVVDAKGKARAVVATRDEGDPHRDLWWAHAGGGGGNLGVITRFWLRTPGVTSSDPTALLPKAPGDGRRRTIMWPWESMTEAAFSTLLRNYCTWYERNSEPGTPSTDIWGVLLANHRSAGVLGMVAVIDDALPDASRRLNAHVDAVAAGVGVTPVIDTEQVIPWMTPQNWPLEATGRYKHKAGDLRSGYSDRQIATIWRYLEDRTYDNPAANLGISGFGGQVNAPAPDATATAQRDAILKAVYSTGNWADGEDGARHLTWVRDFYRDVYAETGGVPVPDRRNAGSYINYPDVDLLDTRWNTSGVPWTTLYYRGNYPRLQRVKKQYDPRNVFRHPMSIAPPAR